MTLDEIALKIDINLYDDGVVRTPQEHAVALAHRLVAELAKQGMEAQSMNTLDELAREIATDMQLYLELGENEVSEFAHRLVAELAKQEPVFEVGFGWLDTVNIYPNGTKFYAAPIIPAGWVMVPEEPTDDMWRAGVDTYRNTGDTQLVYKAMLSAAPKGEGK